MKTPICPACEVQGHKVSLKTVKRMLTKDMEPAEMLGIFYACTSPYCFTAYYKQDGTIFPIQEVKVPHHTKAFYSDPVVCHCGQVTTSELKKAVLTNGATTIKAIADITGATRHGKCDCNNPLGKCCIDDVRSLLAQWSEDK